MTSQEKMDFFIDHFKKLDESRKDYILELTRKLAEIHRTADFQDEFDGNRARDEDLGIYPA
jgi:hypothetical protein